MVPCSDSAEPRGRVSRLGRSPSPFNLSRRRLCNPLGRSLGCAAHCCAISVARARAALTATLPRSIRSSARRTTVGAPKSRSLVNFMIRPPAFGWWPEPHPTTRITPPDRGLLMAVSAVLGAPSVRGRRYHRGARKHMKLSNDCKGNRKKRLRWGHIATGANRLLCISRGRSMGLRYSTSTLMQDEPADFFR